MRRRSKTSLRACAEKRERMKKILCCLKLHFLLIVVCLTSHTSVFIWRLFHSDAKSKKWWWLLIIVAIEAAKKDFHNQLIREFIQIQPMRLIIVNFSSETVTCLKEASLSHTRECESCLCVKSSSLGKLNFFLSSFHSYSAIGGLWSTLLVNDKPYWS